MSNNRDYEVKTYIHIKEMEMVRGSQKQWNTVKISYMPSAYIFSLQQQTGNTAGLVTMQTRIGGLAISTVSPKATKAPKTASEEEDVNGDDYYDYDELYDILQSEQQDNAQEDDNDYAKGGGIVLSGPNGNTISVGLDQKQGSNAAPVIEIVHGEGGNQMGNVQVGVKLPLIF